MSGDKAVAKFPRATLLVVVILTAVVVIGGVLAGGWVLRDLDDLSRRSASLASAQGAISYYDEALTMSARLAASTGDVKWADRYDTFLQPMDDAIKNAGSLAPQDLNDQLQQETGEANTRLVELETQALDLVRKGQAAQAAEILYSDKYEANKKILADGSDSFNAALNAMLAAERSAIGQRIFTGGIAAALALLGLIFAWLKVYRTLARWSVDMNELLHRRSTSERELAQQAEDLRERDNAAGTANQHLSDAVESLNDGFVLWDKNGKLVICNSRYVKIYPLMADLNVPGTDFETHVRTAVARGMLPEAIGREDAFVAERLARHRAANSAHLRQLPDGRWFRVSEHRTAAGGVVGVHADVTDQKNAELAVRESNRTLSATSQQLTNIVRHAVDGVTAIKSATAKLATGSGDLSVRTEEQVTSLEEMASAIRELTETLKSNTGNAQEASALANATRQAAESGGAVAKDAVAAMEQIEVSSRRISDIIGMIEEIAFQTNLLALNAAVEAARAGDAGRGFAVVAQEVRALSMRASEASREIRTLVTNSSSHVGQGVELVRKAGTQLGEIVVSVKKVAEIVGEMASAIREQSSGMQLVAETVTDMESMTQKNAVLVESSTSALNEVDRRLAALIDAIDEVKDVSNTGAQDPVLAA
ncbi:MAG TPA: methyl-accepting chemotaxis protein [Verrucomicrobiae bacterium]|nr:methyl-accepting chemotaxis protein [Verrucomicrobiae bacterium]